MKDLNPDDQQLDSAHSSFFRIFHITQLFQRFKARGRFCSKAYRFVELDSVLSAKIVKKFWILDFTALQNDNDFIENVVTSKVITFSITTINLLV